MANENDKVVKNSNSKKSGNSKTSTAKKSTTSNTSVNKKSSSKKSDTAKTKLKQSDKKLSKTSAKPKNVSINDVETKINDEVKNLKTEIIKDEQFSKKNLGLFEFVLLAVIIALVFSLAGYFIGRKGNLKSDDNYVTVNKEIQSFIEEYNYILENYYGEIDKEELIANAIDGMLTSLDDYSQFIDDSSNNFDITLEGEYDGLGIGIYAINGEIIIATVYPNTPASKAGLKSGDIITKLNGEELKDVTTNQVVDKIAKLDNVKLTILRDDEELEFEMQTEHVVLDSVHYDMKDNNIGYIKVDVFAKNTYDQFEKALKELENQKMASLIIDLRGNTGGHLSSVRDMISLFLDDSHVIYQTEDKNGVTKQYSTGDRNRQYKIVILQDVMSASASEVMASALREQMGAYIIGNTSYGKGTVQTLQEVTGIGEYKITTQKWLTSNGQWIEGVGIKPDLEVLLTEEYLKEPTLENDSQYQAAIEYLKD